MRLPRASILAFVLSAAALAGCKQDIGERCEQGSDCSSGYCDYTTVGQMTSAAGRVCTGSSAPPGEVSDAAPAPDAEGDVATSDGAGDAAETGDASGTPDAQADTAASDVHGDTGAADATLEAGAGG